MFKTIAISLLVLSAADASKLKSRSIQNLKMKLRNRIKADGAATETPAAGTTAADATTVADTTAASTYSYQPTSYSNYDSATGTYYSDDQYGTYRGVYDQSTGDSSGYWMGTYSYDDGNGGKYDY